MYPRFWGEGGEAPALIVGMHVFVRENIGGAKQTAKSTHDHADKRNDALIAADPDGRGIQG